MIAAWTSISERKTSRLLLAVGEIGGRLLILIWGGFMIIWGLFIGMLANSVKPWLIGFGVELPMSLTLRDVFGGFFAFGFRGLFIGPTLVAIMFTLVSAWRAVLSGPLAADVLRSVA